MEKVLTGIDAAEVYIDYVGAFSSSWQDHISLLDTILHRLCDNGFTVNPLSVNGPSKKQIGLAIGSHPMALSPGKRKSMRSCTWTVPAPPPIFVGTSAALIFIGICGLAVLTS